MIGRGGKSCAIWWLEKEKSTYCSQLYAEWFTVWKCDILSNSSHKYTHNNLKGFMSTQDIFIRRHMYYRMLFFRWWWWYCCPKVAPSILSVLSIKPFFRCTRKMVYCIEVLLLLFVGRRDHREYLTRTKNFFPFLYVFFLEDDFFLSNFFLWMRSLCLYFW